MFPAKNKMTNSRTFFCFLFCKEKREWRWEGERVRVGWEGEKLRVGGEREGVGGGERGLKHVQLCGPLIGVTANSGGISYFQSHLFLYGLVTLKVGPKHP